MAEVDTGQLRGGDVEERLTRGEGWMLREVNYNFCIGGGDVEGVERAGVIEEGGWEGEGVMMVLR